MFDDAGIGPSEVQALARRGLDLARRPHPAEWDEVRLEGSTHLPMDQVVARLDEVPERVICVCAVGARSARVADYLQARAGKPSISTAGSRPGSTEGRPVGVAADLKGGTERATRCRLTSSESGAHTTWWAERVGCWSAEAGWSTDRPNLTG